MLQKTSRVGLILTLLLVLALCSATSLGLGLAPCEMRITNAQGSGVVGTLVVVNSDNEPRWITLQVMPPTTKISELKYMRVICEGCHDSHQRYEVIPDYTPTADDELVGVCPICNSTDLTFFEPPPYIIFENIELRGKNCELIDEGNGKYRINELLAFRDERSIDIVFRVPRDMEYAGKHYEIYVMAASHAEEQQGGMGIIPGILMRLLIDTKPMDATGGLLNINQEQLLFVGLGILAISGGVGGTFFVKKYIHKRKQRSVLRFPESSRLESGGSVHSLIDFKVTDEEEERKLEEMRQYLDKT